METMSLRIQPQPYCVHDGKVYLPLFLSGDVLRDQHFSLHIDEWMCDTAAVPCRRLEETVCLDTSDFKLEHFSTFSLCIPVVKIPASGYLGVQLSFAPTVAVEYDVKNTPEDGVCLTGTTLIYRLNAHKDTRLTLPAVDLPSEIEASRLAKAVLKTHERLAKESLSTQLDKLERRIIQALEKMSAGVVLRVPLDLPEGTPLDALQPIVSTLKAGGHFKVAFHLDESHCLRNSAKYMPGDMLTIEHVA